MFTIEQIKAAHSKVKSGADFPAYIAELKQLGVVAYEHFVTDGRINYLGKEGGATSSPAKYPEMEIAEESNAAQLIHYLKVHQQGKTDYLSFCADAAAVGVTQWVVDLEAMTCTYLDKSGQVLLEERIPG